jgi:hypothetical protein
MVNKRFQITAYPAMNGSPNLAAATVELVTAMTPEELDAAIEDWHTRYQQPPCQECGAMTPEEAEAKCRCSGDKDHCHGCDLWPD